MGLTTEEGKAARDEMSFGANGGELLVSESRWRWGQEEAGTLAAQTYSLLSAPALALWAAPRATPPQDRVLA